MKVRVLLLLYQPPVAALGLWTLSLPGVERRRRRRRRRQSCTPGSIERLPPVRPNRVITGYWRLCVVAAIGVARRPDFRNIERGPTVVYGTIGAAQRRWRWFCIYVRSLLY